MMKLSEIDECIRSGKSLAIACSSSYHRRIIHQIAQDLELEHISIRTNKFPVVFLYKSPNCKSVSSNVIKESRGAVGPKIFCRCAQGGSFATLKKFSTWNAVVIGKNLELKGDIGIQICPAKSFRKDIERITHPDLDLTVLDVFSL